MFNFFFQSILFIAAVFICFYLPARFLVDKFKLDLNPLEKIFFSIAFGLILFTFLSFILVSIKLLWLIIPLILIIDFIYLKNLRNYKNLFCGLDLKKQKTLFLILTILALLFSSTIWGAFGEHDSWWHISLINELKAHFPPDHPGFAGLSLKGYHFFFNFILAQISSLFRISSVFLYFHFFPILISFLWIFGLYVLMMRWIKNTTISLVAVFLSLFGGDFSFIPVILGYKLSLGSGFGMLGPATSLINPPFSISIVIIIYGLFSLHNYLQTKKTGWVVPLILFFGLASEFKIYAGIILLIGFGFLILIKLMRKKIHFLGIGLLILVLFFLTYWRFTGSYAYLIFHPLWPLVDIFKSYFPSLGYDIRINSYLANHEYFKFIILQGWMLILYLLGNLGTRSIGLMLLFFLVLRKKIFFSDFTFSFFIMICVSFFIPMFFIQSIKVFEITQMFNYFLFFSSILAAIGFSSLFSFSGNKIFKLIIFSLILFLTLPSPVYQLSKYINYPRLGFISSSMSVLGGQGDYSTTLLELPPKRVEEGLEDLLDWYRSESTPQILALSNKRGYLNNEYIEFPGLDINPRINLLKNLIKLSKMEATESGYFIYQERVGKELRKSGIKLLYSRYPIRNSPDIKNIYDKNEEYIYKVNEN